MNTESTMSSGEIVAANFALNQTVYQQHLEAIYNCKLVPTQGWLMPTPLPTIDQGWKLHISATVLSAEEILLRALPVLKESQVAFKVSANPGCLVDLNSGSAGYSQVGKFITVYPESDQQALRLARSLVEATRGLAGPAIHSDNLVSTDSPVYYRYGGFNGLMLIDDLGQKQPAIRTPDNGLVADVRGSSFVLPSWVCDPFVNFDDTEKNIDQPSILFGQYLILSVLLQSAKGGVYLALDTGNHEPRTCVLKEGRRHCGTTPSGDDARVQIKKQFELMQLLHECSFVPEVYKIFDAEGNRYLSMAYIEGETLGQVITKNFGEGRYMSATDTLDIAIAITMCLTQLHERGWIFRDLTPSNIMISQAGHNYLLDFELAHHLNDSHVPYGWGTPGYASPQQANHQKPSVSDDIYALGATCYFALTGADPSYVNNDFLARLRALRLLRPDVDLRFLQLVSRMMTDNPLERPSSMENALMGLQSLKAIMAINYDPVSIKSSRLPLHCGSANKVDDEINLSHYLDTACEAGDWVLAEAEPFNEGICWASKAMNFQREVGSFYLPRKAEYMTDLHNGAAGIGLFLARLGRSTGIDRYMQGADQAARWLLQPDVQPSLLPGLHFGRAGTAVFLAELADMTANMHYALQASQIARELDSNITDNPDMTHGLAGIGLVHLLLVDLGNDFHQKLAVDIGDRLLVQTESISGGIAWRHPTGNHVGMSGEILPGLAHGSAGIAYFLLQLWKLTQQEKYLNAVLQAVEVLYQTTIPCGVDNKYINWPVSITSKQPDSTWFYWCHGAMGIGTLLLDLEAVTGDGQHRTLAEAAIQTIMHAGKRGGGALCHGLPGNGSLLLRAYKQYRSPEVLQALIEIADLLTVYAIRDSKGVSWPSEQSGVITPDYMVGCAGTADFLRRVALPNQIVSSITLPVL